MEYVKMAVLIPGFGSDQLFASLPFLPSPDSFNFAGVIFKELYFLE